MKKQTLLLDHKYRPAKPEKERPPAIIMLHGYGSDENDLFSFAGELPEKYAIFSLKAPIRMEPYGNAWYTIYFENEGGKFSDDTQAVASRELISKCIDEIIEKYEVDKNNVTLLGFSQGSILAFAVALSYPEKIQRVIALSGYVNPSILKENYEQNDFGNLKVYTSHGSSDQVIPVEWARKTKSFLTTLDIPCKYSEFPIGHGVSPQNFFELKDWLAENP